MPTSPTNDSLLGQQIVEMGAKIASLSEEVARLRQLNALLQLKIDKLARKLFGASSEKLDPMQMEILFEALQAQESMEQEEEEEEEESIPRQQLEKTKARSKRRSADELIEGLEVVTRTIDPPEVIGNPDAYECIGSEVTKLIDFQPAKFTCQEIIRRRYVRKDARHEAPIIAPGQAIVERCIAAPGLLANTAVQRFEYHLPYYRIEQMYQRMGKAISRQTLCGWMGMCDEVLRPIMLAIQAEAFADGYVQIDETPVKYQDPERNGSCGTGYLWVVYNTIANICFFVWHTSRAAQCLEEIVPAGFTGIIQSDAYSAYDSFANKRNAAALIIDVTSQTVAPVEDAALSPPPQLAAAPCAVAAISANNTPVIMLGGCMAHARRKFHEAKEESADARWVLAELQELYQIEAKLRETGAGRETILATRQQQSKPILDVIKAHLEKWKASHKHLPKSNTGQAISYTLNQWGRLCLYLEVPAMQIDNNLVENAIGPSAIGKKNWLFMGDATTGSRAATFYTLIGNCHRLRINAADYLTDIFKRLPDEMREHTSLEHLTPRRWLAERQARSQAVALSQTLAAAAAA